MSQLIVKTAGPIEGALRLLLQVLAVVAVFVAPFTILASTLLVGCGVLVIFLPGYLKAVRVVLKTRVFWFSMLLFLWACVNAVGYGVPHHSIGVVLKHLFSLVALVFLGCLFVERQAQKCLLQSLMLSGILSAFFYVLLFFSRVHPWLQTIIHMHGIHTLVDEGVLKHIQERSIWLAVTALLLVVQLKHAFAAKKKWQSFFILGSVLIVLFALFHQPERIGLIVFMILACYLLYQFAGVVVSCVAAATLVIIFTAIVFMPGPFARGLVGERMTQLGSDIKSYQFNAAIGDSVCTDNGIRLNEYRVALQRIKKSPIRGYGTGSLEIKGKPLLPIKCIGSGVENYYLTIAYDLGLVGLLLLVLMLYEYYKMIHYLDWPAKMQVRLLLGSVLLGCMTFVFLFCGNGLVLMDVVGALSVGSYLRCKLS